MWTRCLSEWSAGRPEGETGEQPCFTSIIKPSCSANRSALRRVLMGGIRLAGGVFFPDDLESGSIL